jgi:hypothetical protein
MKTKSASRSAFFSLRVLIGLFAVLTGVFLALVGVGVLSAPAANVATALGKHQIITSSSDRLVPVGFDCSTIHEKGIDKQENSRAEAIMITRILSRPFGLGAAHTSLGRTDGKIFAPPASAAPAIPAL